MLSSTSAFNSARRVQHVNKVPPTQTPGRCEPWTVISYLWYWVAMRKFCVAGWCVRRTTPFTTLSTHHQPLVLLVMATVLCFSCPQKPIPTSSHHEDEPVVLKIEADKISPQDVRSAISSSCNVCISENCNIHINDMIFCYHHYHDNTLQTWQNLLHDAQRNTNQNDGLLIWEFEVSLSYS